MKTTNSEPGELKKLLGNPPVNRLVVDLFLDNTFRVDTTTLARSQTLCPSRQYRWQLLDTFFRVVKSVRRKVLALFLRPDPE